jgi:curved DNA-binding protein CbpA
MAMADRFRSLLAQMEQRSYYDILRVPRDADEEALRQAFHRFALVSHPDRAPDDDPALLAAATEVFKRGVEAYRVLSSARLRARYDAALTRGYLRLDAADAAPQPEPEEAKLPTLASLAETAAGRRHAERADRFAAAGAFEQARLELTNACQNEPFNDALAARLKHLWTTR